MRACSLTVAAALCAACTGGDGQRKSPSDDDSIAPAGKDAPVPERQMIVELRWIQVVDRHAKPGAADEPVRKTTETPSGMDEVFGLPDYEARPAAERPEIRRGEWTLAIPEQTPATFELTVDPQADYRVILFSRGWKTGPDGRATPKVVAKSSWQVNERGGAGHGPDQAGLGEAPPGVWQATKATSRHEVAFAYFELIEARYVRIAPDPPATAERGELDTVEGQRERERTWPIKIVELP